MWLHMVTCWNFSSAWRESSVCVVTGQELWNHILRSGARGALMHQPHLASKCPLLLTKRMLVPNKKEKCYGWGQREMGHQSPSETCQVPPGENYFNFLSFKFGMWVVKTKCKAPFSAHSSTQAQHFSLFPDSFIPSLQPEQGTGNRCCGQVWQFHFFLLTQLWQLLSRAGWVFQQPSWAHTEEPW